MSKYMTNQLDEDGHLVEKFRTDVGSVKNVNWVSGYLGAWVTG